MLPSVIFEGELVEVKRDIKNLKRNTIDQIQWIMINQNTKTTGIIIHFKSGIVLKERYVSNYSEFLNTNFKLLI